MLLRIRGNAFFLLLTSKVVISSLFVKELCCQKEQELWRMAMSSFYLLLLEIFLKPKGIEDIESISNRF